MRLINIRHPTERASFKQAVLQGLGRDQGLYFPRKFKQIPNLSGLLQEAFVPRSVAVLHHLIGDEVAESTLQSMVSSAFDFPVETYELDHQTRALELFHGPSLAFKDFPPTPGSCRATGAGTGCR